MILDRQKEILEKIKVFNDPDFTFNEEHHTYRYKGNKYKSVTTIIKDFCQEFDADYWSRKKAIDRIEEDGGDMSNKNIDLVTEQILKEWDDKRDRSCDLGTMVHLYLEQKFSTELDIEVVEDTEALLRIEKFETLITPRMKDFVSISQELRIFSHSLKISGTIDGLFLRFMEDGSVKLYIIDYKTNGNLKTDKDKNYSKLKAPFGKYWENELNKYSIQLSLYKLILAEYGIKVDDCVLIYLPPSDRKPEVMRCKDLTPELEMYFGVDFFSKLEKLEKNTDI